MELNPGITQSLGRTLAQEGSPVRLLRVMVEAVNSDGTVRVNMGGSSIVVDTLIEVTTGDLVYLLHQPPHDTVILGRADSGWQEISGLHANATNTTSANWSKVRVRRIGDTCQLTGHISLTGTIAANTALFTLPADCWPDRFQAFHTVCILTGNWGINPTLINPSGEFIPQYGWSNGDSLYLHNVSFAIHSQT